MPIVDGLEKIYGERITFLRVNIHNLKNQDLMDQFGFTVTPYILLVDGNGKVLASWDETINAVDVSRAFDQALAASPAVEETDAAQGAE
jgi:hypothetical protein